MPRKPKLPTRVAPRSPTSPPVVLLTPQSSAMSSKVYKEPKGERSRTHVGHIPESGHPLHKGKWSLVLQAAAAGPVLTLCRCRSLQKGWTFHQGTSSFLGPEECAAYFLSCSFPSRNNQNKNNKKEICTQGIFCGPWAELSPRSEGPSPRYAHGGVCKTPCPVGQHGQHVGVARSNLKKW